MRSLVIFVCVCICICFCKNFEQVGIARSACYSGDSVKWHLPQRCCPLHVKTWLIAQLNWEMFSSIYRGYICFDSVLLVLVVTGYDWCCKPCWWWWLTQAASAHIQEEQELGSSQPSHCSSRSLDYLAYLSFNKIPMITISHHPLHFSTNLTIQQTLVPQ